jgi:hypothetical protein
MFHHRAPSFPWCLNLGLTHWWLWQGPGCEVLIRGSWDLVLPDPIPSIRNERFFGIYHGCAIKWTWMLSNQIDIYIYNYNSNYIYTVYIYISMQKCILICWWSTMSTTVCGRRLLVSCFCCCLGSKCRTLRQTSCLRHLRSYPSSSWDGS